MNQSSRTVRLQQLLLLALLPHSIAFLAHVPKQHLQVSRLASTRSPQRDYAWHEYVVNDPYRKSQNGEFSVLKKEYDRLGSALQPYGYRDSYRWDRGYNGPYASDVGSMRRYGYGNYDYGYYPGSQSSYFPTRNNGRYPPNSLDYYGYGRDRYGYGRGNGYRGDYGYGGNDYYGYGSDFGRERYYGSYDRSYDYYPTRSGSYSNDYYPSRGSSYGYGYESSDGFDYGYDASTLGRRRGYGYGRGYRHPQSPVALIMERTAKIPVQGESLKTWSFPSPVVERIHIALSTDGRPLDAEVSLWQGPDNEPVKIRVYAEDGYDRPFSAAIETPRGPNTVTVRNKGQLEFPLNAYALAETPRAAGILPSARANRLRFPSMTIQGGSLRTFPFDAAVESIAILMTTDGRPLDARIELLQGPNNNKQVIEVYSEDGLDRPFFMVVETPGNGHVVRITNTATLEFPLNAWVEPHMLYGEY